MPSGDAKKAEAAAEAQAMLAKAGIKPKATKVLSKTPSKRPVKRVAVKA